MCSIYGIYLNTTKCIKVKEKKRKAKPFIDERFIHLIRLVQIYLYVVDLNHAKKKKKKMRRCHST